MHLDIPSMMTYYKALQMRFHCQPYRGKRRQSGVSGVVKQQAN